MTDPVRPTWDQVWMHVAEAVSARSLCSKAQVGAVIVSARNRIESTGYNGPPADMPFDSPCSDWCPRQRNGDTDAGYATCFSVHAEANALLYVDRSRIEGGTIYSSGSVCFSCAKLIANSGIKRVVMRVNETDTHRNPASIIRFFEAASIEVTAISDGLT